MSKGVAVVTGGAGLIGSHIVDLLLHRGYSVRIIDSLHPQTHPSGKPKWVPSEAEFCQVDVRDVDSMEPVVRGADLVFHQAAFGGFTTESSEYFDVNVTGTARIFEALERTRTAPAKVVVASSQAIFGEPEHLNPVTGELVQPGLRVAENLEQARWDHYSSDGVALKPLPARENLKMNGTTPYALSKIGQELTALGSGRRLGIPTVALRYGVTYGPRQSLTNPYTGVISIFSNRLRNGLAPIIYEDGQQTRDFVFVEDQAAANVALAEAPDNLPLTLNLGTGLRTRMFELAKLLSEHLDGPDPKLTGQYRPGDSRHFYHSTELSGALGVTPKTSLESGIAKFLGWLETQPVFSDNFEQSQKVLAERGVLKNPKK